MSPTRPRLQTEPGLGIVPKKPHKTGVEIFHEDVEKVSGLTKYAAKVGFVLAIICHLLPPHYRVLCGYLASVCHGDLP